MEKIAVIGISCLFPGADNPEKYWQNLIDQKDLTSYANQEQMGVDAKLFYDPVKGKTDKYYCMKGGYIRDFQFDASGYKIPPAMLENLDPLYQWCLYVSQQALQDSGYLNNSSVLSNCGVILGNLSHPTRFSRRFFTSIYHRVINSAIQELLEDKSYSLPGLSSGLSAGNAVLPGYAAGLIAQALSLSRINFCLDAACASSLYAIKLACDYLLSGKADLMLAGAVSCADPLFHHMGFSIFQAYPQNDLTCPLDRSSQGLISSEGAGMVVLKRYDHALGDGDRIYAIINGIGLSNDGKGKFVLNPNTKGQILALQRAYQNAEINPQSIDYIECHATGTPVGDMTELNSMDAYFSRYQARPLIGSVKSNLGHLLTAAGMTSLIKVILSMNKGMIPATINLTEPLSSQMGNISAHEIVNTNIPWPNNSFTHNPVWAAVSAFGFGGTNAHVILESSKPEQVPEKSHPSPTAVQNPLAIVGMAACFGACKDVDALDRTIYTGQQHFIPVPPQRWRGIESQPQLLQDHGFEDGKAPDGAYIQDFDVDFLRFKLPPREEDHLIPQQLLLMKVADDAIKDAGLREGGNVAVIVAMAMELELNQYLGRVDLSWQVPSSLPTENVTLSPGKVAELATTVKNSLYPEGSVNRYTSFVGNIMASRISSRWDFSGAAFTVSGEENSVFKALEIAQMLLNRGEVDAVVVGSVDLAGGLENVLWRHQLAPINTGTKTLSYDINANGWMVGEGAGAVVLKREQTARQQQERIYATIDAIALVQNNSPDKSPQSIEESCHQAFETAKVKPQDIGYLEVFASGIAPEDAAEITGLNLAYQHLQKSPTDHLTCCIGSIKANIGHTYAASGMASLIKTALCLYNQYIPGTPHWSKPKSFPEHWQDSIFYVAQESRTWFLEPSIPKRIAAINGLGSDGSYAHLILSEAPSQKQRSSHYLQQTPFYLFLIAADDQGTLLTQINTLKQHIEHSECLAITAAQTYETFQQSLRAKYKLAIVGHDREELLKEINWAVNSIPTAFQHQSECKTPLGSYFHDVDVDLSPLYLSLSKKSTVKSMMSLTKTITLGGARIYDHIFNADNQARFQPEMISQSLNNSDSKTMMSPSMPVNNLKIMQVQIAKSQTMNNSTQSAYTKPSNIVWDEADLLEFAQGNIASVFGEDYQIIDSYGRRVRLPMPPYLLVSRVTKIDAEKGKFRPSSMTTEYDIPHHAWYAVDGQIPLCVAVESGQCDLLLISYLGIDFENKGDLVYRLLDCTLTFLDDLPKEGETLRYDIKINSFVRSGDNLLFFFSYECFVGEKMVLKMDGGCAGFFSDQQLDQGKGVVLTDKEIAQRSLIQKQYFAPLLVCQKLTFDESDMLHLTEGNIAACFGDHYNQYGLNPSLRLPPKAILMIDRVTSVQPTGGAWGLGLIIGEKFLDPEHWYFPCHFQDDQVLAGSLIAEGCSHLLEFYMLYLGLQTYTTDARFQPIPHLPQVVRCRGQVTPISARLIYRIEITEIGLTPRPYVKCNVDVILHDKITVNFQDLGLQLSEKNPHPSTSPESLVKSAPIKLSSPKPALLNEEQVQEFCTGSAAKCFGAEYAIYDQGKVICSRMPNTHLQLVHRVLEVQGERHSFTKGSTIVTEYDAPVDPWYYRQNSSETIPYSILMEMGLQPCGFLSAYLGTTLLYPEQTLCFRNLDGEGYLSQDIDIRGKTVTNTSTLLSSTNMKGNILQSFAFQLACEGEVFYKGTASFGYFSPEALANQVGLDRGQDVRPWYETQNMLNLPVIDINLLTLASRDKYYQVQPSRPHYRLAQYELDLLNELKIVATGGKYQQGYIYGHKEVKPSDWYFKCHFYLDPVMPGSLGVEAILQAMQAYALHLDLGKHLKSPQFVPVVNHQVIWKYRGQIPHGQTQMYLEVHISRVEVTEEKVMLVADASLWKPNLRIYEVKDVAVCLVESRGVEH